MNTINLNIITTKFKELIKPTGDSESLPIKQWTIAAIVLGLCSFFISQPSLPEKQQEKLTVDKLDTFIPEGMSLVPVTIINYESLDQIIGKFGVVDLLRPAISPNEKPKKVAHAVKLIQAPLNPEKYSALVPSDKVHKLASYSTEFIAVVRNPKSIGTKFVKERSRSRRLIQYELE